MYKALKNSINYIPGAKWRRVFFLVSLNVIKEAPKFFCKNIRYFKGSEMSAFFHFSEADYINKALCPLFGKLRFSGKYRYTGRYIAFLQWRRATPLSHRFCFIHPDRGPGSLRHPID